MLTYLEYTMQEVEYVKQEAKLVYLLECLQKTAPPVLIFAEKQTDVDDVHEYLMSKDVDAVAVHGQKTQEERAEAIDHFKVCCASHSHILEPFHRQGTFSKWLALVLSMI